MREVLRPGTQRLSEGVLMVTRAPARCLISVRSFSLFGGQTGVDLWNGSYMVGGNRSCWTPDWSGQLFTFHTASSSVLKPHLQKEKKDQI